jgi:protein-S-isoprenylcysteine O-methyltransferase Ste14
MFQAMNQDGFYDRHPELIPPNIWGFVGARWWDVVLLILFIALFVWEIKVLFTRAEKRNRNEMGS